MNKLRLSEYLKAHGYSLIHMSLRLHSGPSVVGPSPVLYAIVVAENLDTHTVEQAVIPPASSGVLEKNITSPTDLIIVEKSNRLLWREAIYNDDEVFLNGDEIVLNYKCFDSVFPNGLSKILFRKQQ